MELLDSWATLTAPTRGTAMAPRHLPPVVRTRTIGIRRTRELLASGEYTQVRRGVIARCRTSPASGRASDEVLAHAHAIAVTHPSGVLFSHQTAVLLLGGWLLWPALPVHVRQCTPISSQLRRDAQLRRHLGPVQESEIRAHDDVLVTSPELTLIDCARTSPFLEAVVAADSLARLGADRERAATILEACAGGRGVVQARRVLATIDGVPESPGESAVRGIAVDKGLPAPRPQVRIRTSLGVKELDLGWEDRRAGIEFDGAVKYRNLTAQEVTRRIQADMARHEAITAQGWTVLRVRWDDFSDLPGLATRLLRLYRDGVALRPPGRARY
ncbi:hypothetical protein [Serinibacter salmoneus]|uniref:Transcriptional regulator, AbiEi antitoxin, Type IV TA system n=1 Tax=Serinibacter salmoneus TaxID=556530 RepID=A0A2A9D0Y6_9MICO|nr:hypothetical protein [Serinibacter salmoneus]PFG19925.1 hypothetical protein ATL40_1502 [Serinibacter salmoneus]